MERYDYREAIKNDVMVSIMYDYNIEDFDNLDEFREKLNEDLWIDDGVTGNASGSYTFSTWKAEENLCHNLDLLKEAFDEFGGDLSEMLESPESCDVIIRCYLLGAAIEKALEELGIDEDNPGFRDNQEEEEE